MKISAIIPSYKPQDYIWECLDSLKQQTFDKTQFEIILVLNGCCEPYKSQIQSYIDENLQDFNVVFIQTDVGGVSNARNMALDIARGEYITFIDDDDYISPSYLEELYNVSSRDTIGISYPYAFNDGIPDVQISYRKTDLFNKKALCEKQHFLEARKFFSGPCMKLIHRDIIQDKRFDERFKNGEDSLFMFYISDKFKSIQFTPKKAIYYRRLREGSAFKSTKSVIDVSKNSFNLMCSYTSYYIKNVRNYNFVFYITRVLAAFKQIVLSLKSKI